MVNTYQDMNTDYTESDGNSRLTQTDTRSTFTALQTGDANHWLYKDFTVSYFGDFTSWFEFNITSQQANSVMGLLLFSTELDEVQSIDGTNDAIGIIISATTTSVIRVTLIGILNGSRTSSYSTDVLSVATQYYARFQKRGAIIGVWVYSDASMTTLVYTHTIAITSANTYRYLMCPVAWQDSADTSALTGYVENLLLEPSTGNDPKYIVKNILHDMVLLKDDAATYADILHLYEGGRQSLKTLVDGRDVIILYGDSVETNTRYIQDDPMYKTHSYPIRCVSSDKYSGATLVISGSVMQDKIRDQMYSLIEAAAQGSAYTIRVPRAQPRLRDLAGVDVWEQIYTVDYRESG